MAALGAVLYLLVAGFALPVMLVLAGLRLMEVAQLSFAVVCWFGAAALMSSVLAVMALANKLSETWTDEADEYGNA